MQSFKTLLRFCFIGLVFSSPFANVARTKSCRPWLTTFDSEFKLVVNIIGNNSGNAPFFISATTNYGDGSAWILDQKNNIRFTLTDGAINGRITNPNEYESEVGGNSGLIQIDPTIPNFIPSSGIPAKDESSGLVWLAWSDSDCHWTLVPVINQVLDGTWYVTEWNKGSSVFYCTDMTACESAFSGSGYNNYPIQLQLQYH